MNEWSDVETALESTDQVLAAIGNLAGWDRNRPVYVTTLIRSVGSVASQLALLVSLGYVRLDRQGQNSTVYITQDGIDSVLEPDDDDGICPTCNGSGEGMADGTTCPTCGGSGDESHPWGRRRQRDPEDYEYDDPCWDDTNAEVSW